MIATSNVIMHQITLVRKALTLSLFTIIGLTLVSVFFFGIVKSRALFLGALVSWLSYLLFAWHAFRYTGATQVVKVYKSMWQAHMFRWVITVIGFMFIFLVYRTKAPLYAVTGYVIMSSCYTIMLLALNFKKN